MALAAVSGSNWNVSKPDRAGTAPEECDPAKKAQRRFRLVLADDHHDVREEVCHLLEPEFDVLRAVGKGAAALTMCSEAYVVKAALEAGIRAYVLKMDASEELIPAIYAAVRNQRYLSRGIRDGYGA